MWRAGMSKPILCLDFDGVYHSYTSGWKGADVIADPPVDGLFDFLVKALEEFEVHIYSSRSNLDGGIEAMREWFGYWEVRWNIWYDDMGMGIHPISVTSSLKFPKQKPPAHVTLDDRGLIFIGVWPNIGDLKAFKPWNRNVTHTDNSDYKVASSG